MTDDLGYWIDSKVKTESYSFKILQVSQIYKIENDFSMATMQKCHTPKFLENTPFLDQFEETALSGKFIFIRYNEPFS